MRRIERLKKEALHSCKRRGHEMSRWTTWPRSYMSECVKCGLYVQVIPKPLPNEIEIGGTAVAVNCDGGIKIVL